MTDDHTIHNAHVALTDALVVLRAIDGIHPEMLDVQSILELQKMARQAMPKVEVAMIDTEDPDDPIVTDD